MKNRKVGRSDPPAVMVKSEMYADCLFNREWCTVVIDEAHAIRSDNRAYRAALRLRTNARLMIAMTATPLFTSPLDLSHIGRALGIPLCCGAEAEAEDTAALGRVRQLQRKLTADDRAVALEVTGRRLEGNLDDDLEDPRRFVRLELLEQVRQQRNRWFGRVIRRTTESKDNEGVSVMRGLPPLTKVTIMLDLSQEETDMIVQRAEDVKTE